MIFFIVARNASTYESVKEPAPEAEDWTKLHTEGQFKLIAWNEVPGWGDPMDMLVDVLAAARQDLVCRWMRHSSMRQLGLEPFTMQHDAVPAPSLDEKGRGVSVAWILTKLIFHWCSPAVGNIASSPKDRPKGRDQFLAWKEWKLKNNAVLDKTTVAAVEQLFHQLPLRTTEELGDGEWERERRDQVKLFHNITEAARAFVGEVTTTIVKRIEKIFALQLCRSERLLAAQRHLLTSYVQAISFEQLLQLSMQKYSNFEYVNFFLQAHLAQDITRAWSPVELVEFVQFLLRSCLASELDSADYKTRPWHAALQFWLRFPPTVRCAMILNLLRKLNDAVVVEKHGRGHVHRTPFEDRARMTIGRLPALDNPHQALPEYTVVAGAAPLTHVPAMIPFARAWNRAEYDITEITYRIYCCPTWAGNSGHAAEAMQHYITALGSSAPTHTAQTIAASLFMFWRLYYDRRITPVHTLVDTFEATFNAGIVGVDAAESTDIDGPVDTLHDAWGFVQRCSVAKKCKVSAVNPIALMTSLVTNISQGKRWPELSTIIKDQLELEVVLATRNGRYVMPRWSKGIDPRLVNGPPLKPAKL